MNYKEKFCKDHGFSVEEVERTLPQNINLRQGAKHRNWERDDEILRALFREETKEDLATRYSLSVARIRDIEKAGLSRLCYLIRRQHKINLYTIIDSYASAAAMFQCPVNDIQKVIGNPTICMRLDRDKDLRLFVERVSGRSFEDIGKERNCDVQYLREEFTDVASAVERSVIDMNENAAPWDKDRDLRSIDRFCRQWGVSVDDLEWALRINQGTKLTTQSINLLICWIKGKSAEETVKDTGLAYEQLKHTLDTAWGPVRTCLSERRLANRSASETSCGG